VLLYPLPRAAKSLGARATARLGARSMDADLPRLAPTRGPRGPCFCLMALLLLLGVLALGAAALALREPCAGVDAR